MATPEAHASAPGQAAPQPNATPDAAAPDAANLAPGVVATPETQQLTGADAVPAAGTHGQATTAGGKADGGGKTRVKHDRRGPLARVKATVATPVMSQAVEVAPPPASQQGAFDASTRALSASNVEGATMKTLPAPAQKLLHASELIVALSAKPQELMRHGAQAFLHVPRTAETITDLHFSLEGRLKPYVEYASRGLLLKDGVSGTYLIMQYSRDDYAKYVDPTTNKLGHKKFAGEGWFNTKSLVEGISLDQHAANGSRAFLYGPEGKTVEAGGSLRLVTGVVERPKARKQGRGESNPQIQEPGTGITYVSSIASINSEEQANVLRASFLVCRQQELTDSTLAEHRLRIRFDRSLSTPTARYEAGLRVQANGHVGGAFMAGKDLVVVTRSVVTREMMQEIKAIEGVFSVYSQRPPRRKQIETANDAARASVREVVTAKAEGVRPAYLEVQDTATEMTTDTWAATAAKLGVTLVGRSNMDVCQVHAPHAWVSSNEYKLLTVELPGGGSLRLTVRSSIQG